MARPVSSVALVVLCLLSGCCGTDQRYLVYTSGGGVFKFIIGFAVPVNVPMPLVLAHNFQFQYMAIDNATKWSELAQAGILRSLDYSRELLHSHLHSFFNSVSEEPGCLLRVICEIGEAPIARSGLAGELIHLIFKPEEEVSIFGSAWKNGSEGLGCESLGCPLGRSLLHGFSFLSS